MNKFAKIIGGENTYGHNIPQGTIVEVIEDESTDEQPEDKQAWIAYLQSQIDALK